MTFFIVTLGCPKNEVDSAKIAQMLTDNGHQPAEKRKDADFLIVNTCGFIDTAKAESIEAILKAASGKKPGQKLVAAGCLAQRYPADLTREIPEIDAIVGTRDLDQILSIVGKGEDSSPKSPVLAPLPSSSAYLKIADGCSASCGFCAIPLIKGPYSSRTQRDIIQEARDLVARGAKELVLIAQDSTAYGYDFGEKDALATLIDELLVTIPELPWLRIMYAYPTHLTDKLIDLMAQRPQICHYLDLPLQHAHPDTLRRMRRPGDIKKTNGLIARLRSAMPDIALRTSLIVGYPGETEAEFATLMEFVSDMKFDRLGVFRYSQEDGTYAAGLPDQVPTRTKKRRFAQLMKLQQAISLEKNRQFVDKELDVLLESDDTTARVSRHAGKHAKSTQVPSLVGRSYRDAPEVDGLVFIEGEQSDDAMVRVKITTALEYDLIGEIAKQ